MSAEPDTLHRIGGCRSDFLLGAFLGEIQVDGFKGVTSLRAAVDADGKAQRRELIEAARGGKHIELVATARTFRQKKNVSNRRYLRLGGDLGAQVGSFKKTPFLVDHNTWEQTSRKGTILSSKLVEESGGWSEFEMSFEAVKPDAVISILDGTLDRFSIGWFALGPVMCTVHQVDVRSAGSCYCWPGDSVDVDGKLKIAEYEFTAWEGKELSGVNIPAVKGTSIEEYRQALTAELNLPPTRPTRPHKERAQMALHRLAAVLGLAALSEADEARGVEAVEALSARAATAEAKAAAAKTAQKQAEDALAAATLATRKVRVDAIITKLYEEGKLRHAKDAEGNELASPREARLRRIANEDGIAALEAEISELEVIVPVRRELQSGLAAAPKKLALGEADDIGPADNPYLASTAEQLGLKLEDLQQFARNHLGEG